MNLSQTRLSQLSDPQAECLFYCEQDFKAVTIMRPTSEQEFLRGYPIGVNKEIFTRTAAPPKLGVGRHGLIKIYE